MDELRVILDAIPAPVFYKDAAGIYRGCNKAFEAYLGKTRAEIVGLDVYGLSPRELADVYKAADDKLFASRGTQIYEARVRYADGTHHDVMFHKACFFDESGALAGLVGTILDITSRKEAERALAESEQRYRAVVSALGEGIVLLAKTGEALAVNPAAEHILGLTREQLAAGAPWPFVDERGEALAFEATPIAAALASGLEHDHAMLAVKRRDGTRAWISLSTRTIAETGAVVVSFADVTERRVFQQQLEHAALHDALTGLPNRKQFMDRLERALEVARRSGERVGVAFIDLDGFKTVNDTHGHEIGDRLLAEIGRRLSAVVRGSDLVARVGGDEFCAILSGITDPATARAVGQRILEALQPALELDGRSTTVTASIGIALYPDHATEPEILLRHADDAMYRIKGGGKNAIGMFA